MDKATKERLVAGAHELGVELVDAQVDKLAQYLALLQTWNRKINLTAITEERAAVELHFLDSLAVVPLVRARNQPLFRCLVQARSVLFRTMP
ncbi:MAG TPA: RsmG family class I SAM-dependent methyltransferase, partial [Polyangia bacterium]